MNFRLYTGYLWKMQGEVSTTVLGDHKLSPWQIKCQRLSTGSRIYNNDDDGNKYSGSAYCAVGTILSKLFSCVNICDNPTISGRDTIILSPDSKQNT